MSNKVYSNYSEAVDSQTLLPDFIIKGIDWLNAKTGWSIPTGASNCTLTATQWIDPNTPISKAQTILNDSSKYGYKEIPPEHLLPGDLVIATNPNNNTHHSMVISDFNKRKRIHNFLGKDYIIPFDHPLVNYSNGSTDESGYRNNIGLMEYVDNSYGKTQLRYFRKNKDNETLLPELIVTPK